jgi:membrane-bound lytic murein transglycosylase B
MPDVIGSVADYLHRHGWQGGRPVTWPAAVADVADLSLVARSGFKPKPDPRRAGRRRRFAPRARGRQSSRHAGRGGPARGQEGHSYWIHLRQLLRDHPLQPQTRCMPWRYSN